MKQFNNISIIVFICALILLASYIAITLSSSNKLDQFQSYAIGNFKVGEKTYPLLIADSPEKWEKGLMFVKKLDNAKGMIFIFPNKEIRTFWNKNTYLDLKVIWMDENSLVATDTLPSVEKSRGIMTVTSPQPVDRVVELFP